MIDDEHMKRRWDAACDAVKRIYPNGYYWIRFRNEVFVAPFRHATMCWHIFNFPLNIMETFYHSAIALIATEAPDGTRTNRPSENVEVLAGPLVEPGGTLVTRALTGFKVLSEDERQQYVRDALALQPMPGGGMDQAAVNTLAVKNPVAGQLVPVDLTKQELLDAMKPPPPPKEPEGSCVMCGHAVKAVMRSVASLDLVLGGPPAPQYVAHWMCQAPECSLLYGRCPPVWKPQPPRARHRGRGREVPM